MSWINRLLAYPLGLLYMLLLWWEIRHNDKAPRRQAEGENCEH